MISLELAHAINDKWPGVAIKDEGTIPHASSVFLELIGRLTLAAIG
jgi:hypothetical protein